MHENVVESPQASRKTESDADNDHGTTRPLEAPEHLLQQAEQYLEPEWWPHERHHGVVMDEEVSTDHLPRRLF